MKRFIPFLILYLFLNPVVAGLFDDDELLPVEQAFAVQAVAADAETVQIDWQVADGYYLYRDKLKFTSNTDGIKLGLPGLPAGKVKHDEFFGDVETYRGAIQITLPITRATGSPGTLALQVASQGCADRGICYPPQKQVLNIKLPEQNASTSGNAIKTLSSLGVSFGLDDEDELLPADEAFRLDVEVADPQTLIARWDIAEGYYLYRDKLSATSADDSSISPLPLQLSAGEKKHDEFFGDIEVYHNRVEARIPLKRTTDKSTEATFTFAYQGCAERGVCYPPIKKVINVLIPAATAATITNAINNNAVAETEPLNDTDSFIQTLNQGSLLNVIIAALGFGLLLAFTACMYPMIPILSSIIVGQGEKATVYRSFILSLVYVEALAITFAVIGAIVGSFSGAIGIQALFQKPAFLIPFAIIFIALAFSMFGFFNLQMPAGLQSRLSGISNRQKGGTLVGVFIMGSLSALIIGPCGGPILIAALTYAATAGPVKGAIVMFALGNGMGLPLLLIGASGGKLLPKAGNWMDTVKAVAGVILLGVAIMFLSRMPHLFSPMLIMLLWAALLIISGIYMGALEPLPSEGAGWRKFWKGLGLVILLYGTAVLIGGLSGARDVTNPFHGSRLLAGNTGSASQTAGNHQSALTFTRIKTVDDLNNALASAKAANKPVMLDFYADWCTYCIQYEEYVFPTPAVRQALADYVLLQADVTATDAEDKALMKKVGVVLPPAILFFDRSNNEQKNFRVVGSMKADAFSEHVNKANNI